MRTPLLFLLLWAGFASASVAQSAPGPVVGEVFLARELDRPPKLLEPRTWYYPADSLSKSVTVHAGFVVDTSGLVEPGSIKLKSPIDSTLADAARRTIIATQYRPGSFHGLAVRVLMDEKLVFHSQPKHCVPSADSPGFRSCVKP
ncbi:MAG TPA: hypothetical protein VJN95_15200 [Gemmatimonadales bacterium]|nr:hypothetical protein [Gemmatimonadales bacterium]